MKISEAKYRANQKWNKENREQLAMSLPIGTKARFMKMAETKGMSMTAFIVEAVEEKIQREGLDHAQAD